MRVKPHLRLRPCLALQCASLLLPWSHNLFVVSVVITVCQSAFWFCNSIDYTHKTRERVFYSRHDGNGAWTIFLGNGKIGRSDVFDRT
jgi:fatty-acid desaturase